MKYGITILLYTIVISGINSQTLMTNLLFEEAKTVFKGKVKEIKYLDSNAEGSDFVVKMRIEKYYKGSEEFKEVSIITKKLEVIDIELDTVVEEFDFQIEKDSTYIFFTKRLFRDNNDSYYSESSISKFIESKIEGIPYSEELERLIVGFDNSYTISTTGYPSIAFSKMNRNSSYISLGRVEKIKEKKNGYKVKLAIKGKELKLRVSRLNCICSEGEMKKGREYIFYAKNKDKHNLKLIDEFLGVMQASEYDKIEYRK